jgi:hypothetical protein
MQESSPGFRQKFSSEVPHLFYISLKHNHIHIFSNLAHSSLIEPFSNTSNSALSSRIDKTEKFPLYPPDNNPKLNSPELSNCVAIIERIYEDDIPNEYSFIFVDGLGPSTYYPRVYTIYNPFLMNHGGLYNLFNCQLRADFNKLLLFKQQDPDAYINNYGHQALLSDESQLELMIHDIIHNTILLDDPDDILRNNYHLDTDSFIIPIIPDPINLITSEEGPSDLLTLNKDHNLINYDSIANASKTAVILEGLSGLSSIQKELDVLKSIIIQEIDVVIQGFIPRATNTSNSFIDKFNPTKLKSLQLKTLAYKIAGKIILRWRKPQKKQCSNNTFSTIIAPMIIIIKTNVIYIYVQFIISYYIIHLLPVAKQGFRPYVMVNFEPP